MSKSNWVMQVPVISAWHLPGPNALKELLDGNYCGALTPYGGFLALGDFVEGEELWLCNLRKWLASNDEKYIPGEHFLWVRFDSVADPIPELEDFGYVWEAMEKASD